MSDTLNFVRKDDLEFVENLGGTREDIVRHETTEDKEILYVSEEFADNLKKTIARHMIDTGEWTQEEANDYLINGMSEDNEVIQ